MILKCSLPYTLIFIYVLCYKLVYSWNCTEEKCHESQISPLKLTDLIPNDYDKLLLPKVDGKPVVIYVKLLILNINYVDEANQGFGIDIFFQQFWHDPRLKMPASHNSSRLVLDRSWRKSMWMPDTYFRHFEEGKMNELLIPYSFLAIDQNDELSFAARLTLKLDCEMNLFKFPHDVQKCEVSMLSLTQTTDNLILKWREFGVNKNMLLTRYFLRGESTYEGIRTTDSQKYSSIVGRIHLARRLGFFLINKYIPSALIVGMSFVTFWIPAEAYPARVTLSVTSLLAIVTQQYSSKVPSVSYVVAMNIWMLSCIGFVFSTLLEYAFAVSVMINKGTKSWPLRKIQGLLPAPKTPMDEENENTSIQITSRNSKISHQFIDRMARFIFPFSFAVFCISYFTFFCIA